MSAFFFYTLFYILMSGCIIYPPTEFVSAGLTIKDIFTNWLGSENEFFIQYHIRRSTITLFIHSILPLGYFLGLIFFGHIDNTKLFVDENFKLFKVLIVLCTLGPLYVLGKIHNWFVNDWTTHPIAQNLSVYNWYLNNRWIDIASNINGEYRRVDKTVIITNSITRIVVTDEWIIKITPYNLQVARHSNAMLFVNKSYTHLMSLITRDQVQFINIQVKPVWPRTQPFDIRLNALDFKDFQDKISQPITILQDIAFHKTLLDRFIDTFKEEVNRNPSYNTTQELDQCIGCMQAISNIKLYKLCDNITENRDPDNCTTCNCRPMWCIECMAKWFASRQDENVPETWLSSKCTCPVCRAKFCILDVCLVKERERVLDH